MDGLLEFTLENEMTKTVLEVIELEPELATAELTLPDPPIEEARLAIAMASSGEEPRQ